MWWIYWLLWVRGCQISFFPGSILQYWTSLWRKQHKEWFLPRKKKKKKDARWPRKCGNLVHHFFGLVTLKNCGLFLGIGVRWVFGCFFIHTISNFAPFKIKSFATAAWLKNIACWSAHLGKYCWWVAKN